MSRRSTVPYKTSVLPIYKSHLDLLTKLSSIQCHISETVWKNLWRAFLTSRAVAEKVLNWYLLLLINTASAALNTRDSHALRHMSNHIVRRYDACKKQYRILLEASGVLVFFLSVNVQWILDKLQMLSVDKLRAISFSTLEISTKEILISPWKSTMSGLEPFLVLWLAISYPRLSSRKRCCPNRARDCIYVSLHRIEGG